MLTESIGDEIIRRWIVAFGVILIFMGLILVSASSSSQEEEQSELVKETEKGWSVSADFAKDENISLLLYPPGSWINGPFDPEETGPGPTLILMINISNPQGGATQFMIHYYYYTGGKVPALLIWKINVTQQHEGLNTTSFYNEEAKMYKAMGGITKYAGTYNATVVTVFPPRDEAPYIAFFKKDTVTEYPYSSFLPAGAATTAAGGGTSLFGLKKPGYKTPPKKKKKILSSKKNQ